MEIEEDSNQNSLSKEEVNAFVRQKLKEYTANRLLRFEKRIQERYTQLGKETPKEISDGTIQVFREFERVCDKYIGMFELYCERNIVVTRIPDTHVTPLQEFSEEEKELDRKLEKRKRELIECRRRKNILQIQRKLIDSDFGKALSRLGAIAETHPMDQLVDNIQSLRKSTDTIQEAQSLTQELLQSISKESATDSWNQLEEAQVNLPFMQGLMNCFDEAGLSCCVYSYLFEI